MTRGDSTINCGHHREGSESGKKTCLEVEETEMEIEAKVAAEDIMQEIGDELGKQSAMEEYVLASDGGIALEM